MILFRYSQNWKSYLGIVDDAKKKKDHKAVQNEDSVSVSSEEEAKRIASAALAAVRNAAATAAAASSRGKVEVSEKGFNFCVCVFDYCKLESKISQLL